MKRKITGLFITFLLCVAAFNGFCQDVNLMPLTWEMVSSVRAKGELKKLSYYLSGPFSIIINEKKNPDQYNATNDGKLDIKGESSSQKEIKFNMHDKGNLQDYNDFTKGREFLVIIYPEQDNKNIILRFVRNSSKNRFELISAVIDTNNYAFSSSVEPPYLTVDSTKPNPIYDIELQAVPISEVRNNPSQRRQGSTNPAVRDTADQVTAGNRYGAIYIDRPGSLTKSAVIEYIRYKNPSISRRTVENLIDAYFREAGKEGINPDLAIAQMCRTTNFLGIERLMQAHNYAGFTSTPEWPGVFYGGMREGVIAHIQHLKGYTSNVSHTELKEPLADPRWDKLDGLRGTINTLEDLSVKWAPYNSRGYYNDIVDIINEMRRFSSQMDT